MRLSHNWRRGIDDIAEETHLAAQSILALSKKRRIETPSEPSVEEEIDELEEDEDEAEELDEARIARTREEASADTCKRSA